MLTDGVVWSSAGSIQLAAHGRPLLLFVPRAAQQVIAHGRPKEYLARFMEHEERIAHGAASLALQVGAYE
jgi:hypothetical protein